MKCYGCDKRLEAEEGSLQLSGKCEAGGRKGEETLPGTADGIQDPISSLVNSQHKH